MEVGLARSHGVAGHPYSSKDVHILALIYLYTQHTRMYIHKDSWYIIIADVSWKAVTKRVAALSRKAAGAQ